MAEEGLQRVGGKLAGLPKTLGTHDVAIGVCSGVWHTYSSGEHLSRFRVSSVKERPSPTLLRQCC
jgi:hypothetical protein